jgi:hypothetical protein
VTDLTDDGLALEMAKAWAGDARYDARRRRWFFRNGAAWERDDTLLHVTRARDFLRAKALAAGSGAEATRLRSARMVARVIRLASRDGALAFSGDGP